MCPDIETVAPLIQATFGAGRVEPDVHQGKKANEATRRPRRPREHGRQAPPRPQGQARRPSPRQTNPVLGVVSLLLELADQRVTASQLLDLADREPVRRRFRFDDDDVTRMEEWVVASGIRWGLDDAAPRAVQARRRQLEHLAGRARSDPARRRDDRRGPAAGRRRAAARRRRERRDRARGTHGRVRRSASSAPSICSTSRRPVASWAAQHRGSRRLRSPPPASATPGSATSSSGFSTTSSPRPPQAERAQQRDAGARRHHARCWPTGSEAGRRGRTSAPAI